MPKQHLVIIFLQAMLLPAISSAQIDETFDLLTTLSSPPWQGDLGSFRIENKRLQLAAGSTITNAICVRAGAQMPADASWEFTVGMDFNPSGSNYIDVWLSADRPDLTSANGYFIRLGGTTDETTLYFRRAGTTIKVIDGTDGRLNQSSVVVEVHASRKSDGSWDLTDIVNGVSDTSHGFHTISILDWDWFGFNCVFTATRSDKFWIDNIHISPLPSTEGRDSIETSDLVFSEIMADPIPSIGLPAWEYVEIFNRTSRTVSLKGLTLSDGTTTTALPPEEIKPHSYVVLSEASGGFMNLITVDPMPSLNNEQDDLMLYAGSKKIDSVHYDKTWYRNRTKEEGGWSLERIDTALRCSQKRNWTSSDDSHGGTPGMQNSQLASHPDIDPPQQTGLIVEEKRITILFDEMVTLPVGATGVLTSGVGAVILKDLFVWDQRVILEPATALLRGGTYQFQLSDISDCEGNHSGLISISFALPDHAAPGDVVVNEILFDPMTGGSDFVELYNASTKHIDISDLRIADFDGEVPISLHEINQQWILGPGDYVVLAEDPQWVETMYHCNPTKVASVELPTMPDDEGTIGLLDRQGEWIDRVRYSASWHSQWLRIREGTSLERLSPFAKSSDPMNWMSASGDVGGATPGAVNSCSRPTVEVQGTITLSSNILNPLRPEASFVLIYFQFESPGIVLSVSLYDLNGRRVQEVLNNMLVGTAGFVRWDGMNHTHDLVDDGYYALLAEWITQEGKTGHSYGRIVVHRE